LKKGPVPAGPLFSVLPCAKIHKTFEILYNRESFPSQKELPLQADRERGLALKDNHGQRIKNT
jgi:hypothetical protein